MSVPFPFKYRRENLLFHQASHVPAEVTQTPPIPHEPKHETTSPLIQHNPKRRRCTDESLEDGFTDSVQGMSTRLFKKINQDPVDHKSNVNSTHLNHTEPSPASPSSTTSSTGHGSRYDTSLLGQGPTPESLGPPTKTHHHQLGTVVDSERKNHPKSVLKRTRASTVEGEQGKLDRFVVRKETASKNVRDVLTYLTIL